MKNKFYITTPIYYPSAEAHIGHAYTTVVCDILARCKRMRGFETFFLTGTDEHGQKIQEYADKKGVTPQEYVDEISDKFKALWKAMKISNDDFIRTTQERHIKVAQKVFSKLYENGDIYLGSYEGWYCTPCESFWTESQIGEDHLCPDCHRPVHKDTEECYFFKTNKYLPELLEIFDKNPKFLLPVSRKNEMMNTFIKPGLNDLCVSRTSLKWGIPIVENPKHTLYVWMDALTNYISALGYGSEDDSKYKKFWEDPDCEIVHMVGADISRFHTIYWPMFLLGCGLRVPDRVFVHGLLDLNGEKMSKSKGNVVSPLDLIAKYGVDPVRWFLVAEFPLGSDGRFTPELFVERTNLNLANNLGNLVNRTLTMIGKYFDGVIPEILNDLSPEDIALKEATLKTIKQYEVLMDDLKINEGLLGVMDLLSLANKYIEDRQPWNIAKEGNINALGNVMGILANVIVTAGILLSPALVETIDKIKEQFGLSDNDLDYKNINNFGHIKGNKINKGNPLFPRLDPIKDTEYIRSLCKK